MSEQKDYLANFGERILAQGYPVIPIAPGHKYPGFDDWQNTKPTPAMIRKWVGNGHAHAGVGIIAATVPAVDLDILEGDLARHMQRWTLRNVGYAPIRIGQYPKRLLAFKSDAPFSKIQSRRFKDLHGRIHKVEILGNGQQFVSHHIHPDTGNPYEWVSQVGPVTVPRDSLTELTDEQAREIVAEFERQALARGWEIARKANLDAPRETRLPGSKLPVIEAAKLAKTTATEDDWSAGIDLKGPIDVSVDELRAKLLLVPAFDDYQSWLEICAALHHQFQDDLATGLELFIEYSSRCDNFDENECIEKWGSFHRSDAANAKTARYILALAKQAQQEAATEQRAEVETALKEATTFEELQAAADLAKHASFDQAIRDLVTSQLRAAHKRVTGHPLSVTTARSMVRYEDPERRAAPRWMEGWCYLTDDGVFYHGPSGTVMSQLTFNNAHVRHMLSKRDVLEGRVFAEVLPADAALNQYQIPCVRNRMYMPHEDEFFTVNGVPYINTYTDRSVPEEPEVFTRDEARDIEIVEAHLRHLFPIDRERELFLSWLGYIVRTMRRPNWAALLQGVEGDGKTFFFALLSVILGPENVGLVTGDALEAQFTAFAEGRLVNVIEEVKWTGHNRHDILNRIKPFITNAAVAVRRMHKDAYTVPNCTAYLLLTNHRDALPITAGDSRYLICQSQWQDRGALLAFMAANPTYYEDLYATIERSPGALRKWLRTRPLHPEFNATARAPNSTGKQYMVALAKGEEQQAIEDVLAESKALDLSPTLLDTAKLADALAEGGSGVVPLTRTMNKALTDLGFTLLGRFMVNKQRARFWSRRPAAFCVDGEAKASLVREFLSGDL
jgi:hypothetical protein